MGFLQKEILMAYVSRYLCSKNPEKSRKNIKITKKGNLIDYVSSFSCPKNAEKILKNI
jgi:hypothetical protein